MKTAIDRPSEELRAASGRAAGPCALVIFGASGDLTKRKLVPALYNLARHRLLPEIADAHVVVTGGFLGVAPDGSTTTLGRGGSDYSAALIGAGLHDAGGDVGRGDTCAECTHRRRCA